MSSDLKHLAARLRAALRAALCAALCAALLGLLGLLAVAAPSASAAPDGPSPGEKIADALRTSPVYVDPSYAASAVPPARQRRLAEQIRRTGLPIKVVLVPLTKGDAFGGEPDTLAAVVRDRLDDVDGKGREGASGADAGRGLILLTTGEWHDGIRGFEWPGDRHEADDAATAVGLLDEFDDAGLADLTAETIRLIDRGEGTEAYERAQEQLDKGRSGHAREDDTADAGDTGTPGWLAPAGAAGALTALCGAVFLVRSARRRSSGAARPTAPFAFPQAVFAAARTADEGELRRRAEAEVLALGEDARAADAVSTPGLRRALDAYDAAGTVLDSARGLPDLAGVLALVTEGRDALDGTPDALPLCFFNPLHGRAARRIGWRPLGRRDQVRVAACADCSRAVRERRAPEVLTDTATDGPGSHMLPYFEADPATSVWAATGYGSLIRREGDGGEGGEGGDGGDTDGAGDGLARRVGRGDFSRGRRG